MSRTCPRCDLAMQSATYPGRLIEPISEGGITIAVDHCGACDGYWFDRHEAEVTMGVEGELRALLADDFEPLDSSNHGELACPAGCDGVMASVRVAGLELDLCGSCLGLWFDSEEIKHLAAALKEQGYDTTGLADGACTSCGHTPTPSPFGGTTEPVHSLYQTTDGPLCRGCLCIRVAPRTAFTGMRRARRTAGAAREALSAVDRDTMRAVRAWSNMVYS